jgi:hypothetical protein
LGAIIGIKVPSITPMTFGKAAIVKKILLKSHEGLRTPRNKILSLDNGELLIPEI